MTVLAHAGHWLVNLAYAAPVIVLVGWLGITKFKERRRGDGSATDRDPLTSD